MRPKINQYGNDSQKFVSKRGFCFGRALSGRLLSYQNGLNVDE
jgi:hypothetical protein